MGSKQRHKEWKAGKLILEVEPVCPYTLDILVMFGGEVMSSINHIIPEIDYIYLQTKLAYLRKPRDYITRLLRRDEITCITTKRSKAFATPLGRFTYQHLNETLFSFAVRLELVDSFRSFLIATQEKALVEGGTALRILYGLNRFSEDLHFSLLNPSSDFKISKFFDSILSELQDFGFSVNVSTHEKIPVTDIQSAFIKANTQTHLFLIKSGIRLHKERVLKVKFEIDTDPPPYAATEARFLLQPIPFSVRAYDAPSLHAGKLHALLCRAWKNRVKGRDWYDWVWFVAQEIPFNTKHFDARMRQTGHHSGPMLTLPIVKQLLLERINSIDVEGVRNEVRPFLQDTQATQIWSREFFKAIAERTLAID